MIRLAVFDIAGTTVYDPDGVGRCLKAALEAAGVPFTHERVNGMMGIAKPVVIRTIADEASMSVDVDAIHEDFRSRMIEYYRTSDEVREIEGASSVFAALQAAGCKVALDTGFDRQIVDAILDRLDWVDVVDFTVASDEVESGRPAPDLVLRAMALAGVEDPSEVAKIGDTPADLHEGTNAGCRFVIGVTHGTHTREMLEPHPHTHIVGSLGEVEAIVTAPRSG